MVDLTADPPVRPVTVTAGPLSLGTTIPGQKPGTVLVGRLATVLELMLTPTRVDLLRSMIIPEGSPLIQSFNRDGTRVLYLTRGGHGTAPPVVGMDPSVRVEVDPGTQLWQDPSARVASTRSSSW